MRYILFLTLISVLLCGCARELPPEKTQARPAGPHPTVQWILACRAGQGGFGCFPGDSAFTTRTGMALEALSDLRALDKLEGQDVLVQWLRARQNADGGFFDKADFYGKGKTLAWGTISALEPTFRAVRALKLLGAEPSRPEAAADFIAARRLPVGGFDSYEYSLGAAKAALYSTYWAVAALKDLGAPVPDSAGLVEWVKSQQDTKALRGGFSLSEDGFFFSTTQGSFYGVATLELLGAKPERPCEVKKFLLSSYGQEPDGGFELGHGDNWNNHNHNSRMKDTYAAVSALQLLDKPLADTDTSRAARPAADCASWVASVQNPDGGFARFGVTDQTPLPTPSEMSATWQAVRTLALLGQPVPVPERPVTPQEDVSIPPMKHRHPSIDFDDPVEVWAFRRIAAPVYEHFLQRTGSRIAAVGMLSRWVREATGPENQASDRHKEGRRALFHGWGQCGTMSLLLQSLAASVDHPARGAYVFADANAEVMIREDRWEKPHWVCYVPFTNEWIDPGLVTPEGTLNGWSALDLAIVFAARHRDYNYISMTKLGDHRYRRVWIENIDAVKGAWGRDSKIDTSMTYGGTAAELLYPDRSW
jgi:prenyltransferase beta subunit